MSTETNSPSELIRLIESVRKNAKTILDTPINIEQLEAYMSEDFNGTDYDDAGNRAHWTELFRQHAVDMKEAADAIRELHSEAL